MNNNISNQKEEVSKGVEMNKKDYLNSLLNYLKELQKNYSIAMTESSCENLYKKYKQVFLNISDLQREVYELMFKKGWYCLEKADTQKINQKFETLNQEYIDLNI